MGSVTLPLPESLLAGMAVASHQPNTTTTGSFSDMKLTALAGPPQAANQPPPQSVIWSQTGDIGAVGGAGGIEYAGGVFVARASGADIWGSSDGLQFASVALPGDGEIIARVIGVEETDTWAKAGVMIRETVAPDSRHAFMAFSAGSRLAFQRRDHRGRGNRFHRRRIRRGPLLGPPRPHRRPVRGLPFRRRHRLDRDGHGRPSPCQGNLRIGLAVTAHTNAAMCTATFDNVTVRSAGPGGGRLRAGAIASK